MKAYARAGVDIDLGNRVKATLPQMLAATHRREVLGKVGGFGGLFALDVKKYRQPVLVSSVDGVGTKLKIAFAMDRHDTIGQDLVNHCVDDIAVLGAEPLFFLDYLGTGKLEPHVFTEVIKGFAKACAENNCTLIGGETAQMPGFYQPGEYDVSGTIVGVVEKSKVIDGRAIRPGDAVLGLASSGPHSNGYSLVRRLVAEASLRWDDPAPFARQGQTPLSLAATLLGCRLTVVAPDGADDAAGTLAKPLASLMKALLVTLRRVAQDGTRVRANAGAASFRRGSTLRERCLADAAEQVERLRRELNEEPGASSARELAAQQRATRGSTCGSAAQRPTVSTWP